MSSMNHTLSRKRLRCPDYRDSDSDEEFRPFKLRRRHGTNFLKKVLRITGVPLIVTNRVRDLLAWITDLNVSDYFKMSVKDGSKLPHETIVLDDDDEEDDDEIQEVSKVTCMKKLAPYIESLDTSKDNECRHSQRLLEKNGSCSLNNLYDIHRTTNGSYDPDSRHRGNSNYNLRQSRLNDLKRPAVISNPDTDIEIMLGAKPDTSVPEADEIEILSELPSTKPKSFSTPILQRTAKMSAVKTSTTAGKSASSKLAAAKPQPTPYTANEVVRLQEKIQYKLLLEKFISTPPYRRANKKPQANEEAQADSSFCTNSHFTKEVLHQPVDDFIQKYYNKPCQLVISEKAKDTNEKEKPSEIKIDDEDDDDDDIQIVDIKLPQPRTRRQLSYTKYLTPEWLADLKIDVSAKAEERTRIDEAYQKELERLKKERLLHRLSTEPVGSQSTEPEFPELTPEMEEKVDQALGSGAPDDQLVKITSDFLLRKDIETLSGLNWLNDLVINSYFDLIVMRSKEEGYPSVYAFNTFFYSNFKTKGYQNIRRWTKKFDIFSFDLNFVPIHLGVHWCLAVIDHRSKKISYYDSMGSGEEKCLEYLHDYLILEYKDKKGQILASDVYTTETRKDIPQQMNGSDCGMFTLKYAEYISRDAEITFNQSHMQYFRRRMVYELLTRQLL